jgi:hypothetical protein
MENYYLLIMKLTNVEILNAREIFVKLSQQQMEGTVALKLLKNLKIINDKVDDLENIRISLFKKYGFMDDDNKFKSEDNDKEGFDIELKELLNKEIDVENIIIFDQQCLKELKITAFEILSIEKFINGD